MVRRKPNAASGTFQLPKDPPARLQAHTLELGDQALLVVSYPLGGPDLPPQLTPPPRPPASADPRGARRGGGRAARPKKCRDRQGPQLGPAPGGQPAGARVSQARGGLARRAGHLAPRAQATKMITR